MSLVVPTGDLELDEVHHRRLLHQYFESEYPY
jgi:hypothetical protein